MAKGWQRGVRSHGLRESVGDFGKQGSVWSFQGVVGRSDDAKRVCVFIFRVKSEACRVINFLF